MMLKNKTFLASEGSEITNRQIHISIMYINIQNNLLIEVESKQPQDAYYILSHKHRSYPLVT